MTRQAQRTDYSQPASQEVEIFGSPEAKDHLPYDTPAFDRTWSTRPVTFTCMVCDKTVTQERYPSRTPSYCSQACKETRQDELNRERVRRHREMAKQNSQLS